MRYSRVDRAVAAAVSEMATSGVSTRKAERTAARMGFDRMSASQVPRMRGSLDDIVADLRGRDLSDAAFPYVWPDATYVKCRNEGRVSSCALVTAIGAGADGYRRLPDPTPSTRRAMRAGLPSCAPCGSEASAGSFT